MDTAKYKLLKDTLDAPFDIERFKKFIRELFNGPNMLSAARLTAIWREYEEYIQCYYRVAEYIDNEDNRLIVLAVELKKGRTVELARSMQRNFVSKILDQYDYNGAIVAFYSKGQPNWRLSFVRLDYTLTEKGLGIKLTPARRYSYLVGENEPKHTAEAQLFPLFEDDKNNPTLDDIEDAFSVERVTKDFFNCYKDKYLQLKEFLENDDNFIMESKKLRFEPDKFAEQFSKKLMGQLAFLYFVQKKGWLGVTLLPKDRELLESEYQKIYHAVDEPNKRVLEKYFIRQGGKRRLNGNLMENEMTDYEAELLSDCFVGTKHDMPWGSGEKRFIRALCDYCINKTEKNFFNYYLEPLFYEALNKKRKNDYYKRFNCKIPFLNGGLFEPLEGYHWKDIKFEIPNYIFSNKECEDDRDADGILDIFDRYNFTINENEPLEKEVAVDPEMLGKIFENLLEVKDRKSKGAFYTPREIVHYMCQESLINYLVNEVNVPYEDTREFILYGELIRDLDNRRGVGYSKGLKIKPSILNKIIEIDKALENVRVADPAVGSGAFPLGMLNEIVKSRNNITEYIIYVHKDYFRNDKFRENSFRRQRSTYRLKLNTIKNSIFAVDIEPSAVDIAKLRLWLSIIVDQDIDEEYPKPQPLPNLDSNIMVGNSLIDEYEGIKLFDKSILKKNRGGNDQNLDIKTKELQLSLLVDDTERLLDEMFNLQSQLFDESNEEKKKEIKEEIDDIRDKLITYTLEKKGNYDGLNKYNQLKSEKVKPYFIWELEFAKVFQEKGGFDIVIGNPPYVGEKGNKELFREIAKTEFGQKYYQGKMDMFYFFFHKAIDIGNDKVEIAFITTNYFITADSAIKLRKDFKERTNIRKIINFCELKIFETALGQHNMITILKKCSQNEIKASLCETRRKGIANSYVFSKIFAWKDEESEYYQKNQDEIYDTNNLYIRINNANSIETIQGSIYHKMKTNSYLIGDRCIVNTGVNTGCDKVTDSNYRKAYGNLRYDNNIRKNDGIFVITKEELDNLKLDAYEMKLIYKFYKNSDIGEYLAPTKWEHNYLIYTTKDTNIDMFPKIKQHLNKYRRFTELKREYAEGKLPWYSLHWAREIEVFTSKDKIVLPYRSEKNIFAYCEEEFFGSKDILYIRKKDEDINLKYVLALLNSKLYYYWLWNFGKRKGKTLELYVTPVSEMPIKYLKIEKQNELVKIIDLIIEIIKSETLEYAKKDKIIEEYKNQIDRLVYEMYELNEDEIKIIEKLHETNLKN